MDTTGLMVEIALVLYYKKQKIKFRKLILATNIHWGLSNLLRQEKERLYKEALKKHEAIIKALKAEADAGKERLDYLQSLNILLQQAVKDLKKDLGVA